MTETSEDTMLPVIVIMIILLWGILYPCFKLCENCKKNSNDEIGVRIAEIDKNLSKRENDWWIEAGGPPVNNMGQIIHHDGLRIN